MLKNLSIKTAIIIRTICSVVFVLFIVYCLDTEIFSARYLVQSEYEFFCIVPILILILIFHIHNSLCYYFYLFKNRDKELTLFNKGRKKINNIISIILVVLMVASLILAFCVLVEYDNNEPNEIFTFIKDSPYNEVIVSDGTEEKLTMDFPKHISKLNKHYRDDEFFILGDKISYSSDVVLKESKCYEYISIDYISGFSDEYISKYLEKRNENIEYWSYGTNEIKTLKSDDITIKYMFSTKDERIFYLVTADEKMLCAVEYLNEGYTIDIDKRAEAYLEMCKAEWK